MPSMMCHSYSCCFAVSGITCWRIRMTECVAEPPRIHSLFGVPTMGDRCLLPVVAVSVSPFGLFRTNSLINACAWGLGSGRVGHAGCRKRIRLECLCSIACATTGLASTLLPNGCTFHRAFGIPVPCNDESDSHLKSGDIQLWAVRNAHFILCHDEATSMHRDLMQSRCIDVASSWHIKWAFRTAHNCMSPDFKWESDSSLHGTGIPKARWNVHLRTTSHLYS